MAVFHGQNVLHRDILAVNTGIKPSAAILLKETIHRKQHAATIASCQNTALFIGINMYHVIQHTVCCLIKEKAKIFIQSQAEAIGRTRLIDDIHISRLRHHHSQILFHFFSSEINHMIRTHFFDLIHSLFLFYSLFKMHHRGLGTCQKNNSHSVRIVCYRIQFSRIIVCRKTKS